MPERLPNGCLWMCWRTVVRAIVGVTRDVPVCRATLRYLLTLVSVHGGGLFFQRVWINPIVVERFWRRLYQYALFKIGFDSN